MDKLEALRIFTAVADSGGFAAAARKLRISPPAVTRAIAGLEDHLGVRLLQRTTRSVRLTDQGAAFLSRCRRILVDLREAEHALKGTQSEPQGSLAVTAPIAFGRVHVVPIVTAVLQRHARLNVQLTLADRNIDLVEEGLDVAVRIGDPPDSSLRAIRVGEVRRVCAASPSYFASRGTPIEPKDLRDHELIMSTAVSASDEWRFGRGEKLRVGARLHVNTAEAAIAAAEGGLGIVRVLSYQISAAVTAGHLWTVLDSFSPAAIPINLLFQPPRHDAPNIRAFLEQARDYFRTAAPTMLAHATETRTRR